MLSDEVDGLNEQDLLMLLETLAFPTPKERHRSDVRSLAELIVTECKKHDAYGPDVEHAHLTILARTGSAIEARNLLLARDWQHERDLMQDILRGLILEARNSDFWQLLDKWIDAHDGVDNVIHQELVSAFVQSDQTVDAQRMFEQSLISNEEPTTECTRLMLELLIRAGSWNMAAELASMLSARIRDENVISTLILYHASKDRQFENLQSTIHNLLQSSQIDISMAVFDDAIEYALNHNQPALAHAIEQVAAAEGLVPDGKTYALQLQHAMDAQDPTEAQATFENLVMADIPKDDYDLKVLNRYIAYLCSAQRPSFELVMRVVDNLLDRQADLDVEAISGLCNLFLQRGDIDDLVGLLRHRIDYMPLTDRTRIAKVFQSFIVDPENNPQKAFNAYELFRIAFAEASCQDRLPMMQSFFDRGRPDLACQVFAHMREADPQDPPRPDENAYMRCFEGIAQTRDVDGLGTVYNMLKLDLQLEITTKIRNALMLAHIACQTPWVAIIDHFYKIMDSREGPSYSSFEVALRACETWPPYGAYEARKIMALVQSWNLEITKGLYDNYVGVMAGQCEFENAVSLIENMVNDIGEAPDAYTIGTFYNAIPWQYRKDEVEKWAKQAYPELWEELESFGDEVDEVWEMRYFKIDRSIDIDDPPLFADGEWKPELQRQMQAQIEPLPVAT